ncbi:3-hydroxyacyl-CoA dehydrogenase [Anaplasma centrale]|uniref:3-hydroxyacyl-CoA dehydrogenase n=1 Tax=Anaplasma centrale TaxID=769 RepID=UPI001EE51901|nr:3-hydroxyacyl-CoA dehydrogenase [Anaplasma centrale]
MRIKKLAVLDPTLSRVRAVETLIPREGDLVLFCNDVAAASKKFGRRVELRNFDPARCDLKGVDWVVELIAGGVDEKAKFYATVAPDGMACFLSSDVQPALRDELSNKVPGQLLRKLTSIRFPTFFRGASVLELVPHSGESEDIISSIKELYKGTLEVFAYSEGEGELFDRIGYFWAATCVSAAYECGIGVEVADHLIANERTGVPPPGPFSILDTLGIDNFLSSLDGLVQRLNRDDPLHAARAKLPDVIFAMISDGFTGSSGCRGGFYRSYDMRDGKMEQVIDLSSGLYRSARRGDSPPEELQAGDECDKFSKLVWEEFFLYIKYLVKSCGGSAISVVDSILQVGYGWKYGIYELAERVNVKLDLQK